MDHIRSLRSITYRLLGVVALPILLLISQSAGAQWYVGIDKTRFDYSVEFSIARLDYEIDATRFKTGYMSKSGFGFDLQFYDTAKDEGKVSNVTGFTTSAKFSSPWAAHVTLTSDGKKFGFYGGIGFIYIDSEVNVSPPPSGPNGDDADDLSLHGIKIGTYYKITKNLNLSLEYSDYDGEVTYENITSGNSNDGFLDVDLSSVSFGLGYMF